MAVVCPINGKVKQDKKSKPRSEKYKKLAKARYIQKIVDLIANEVEGVLSKSEIKSQLKAVMDSQDFMNKHGLTEFSNIHETTEEAIIEEAKRMVRERALSSSRFAGNIPKEGLTLFTKIQKVIKTHSPMGFRQYIADMMTDFQQKRVVLASELFDKIVVAKDGIANGGPKETAIDGDKNNAFATFLNAMIDKDMDDTLMKNYTSAADATMHKLAILYRDHLQKFFPNAEPHDFKTAVLSSTFDKESLLGLRGENAARSKLYNKLLGEGRVKVTSEELEMARTNFKAQYKNTFKTLSEEDMDLLFQKLIGRDSSKKLRPTGVKSTFQDILDTFGDRIKLEELESMHKNHVMDMDEVVGDVVTEMAHKEAAATFHGIDPENTFNEIENFAQKTLSGEELNTFLDRIATVKDSFIHTTMKETNNIKLLSNSLAGVVWQEAIAPIGSMLLLKNTGIRHLLESASSGLKFSSITGNYGVTQTAKSFLRTLVNAEGMLIREMGNTISNLPGLKKHRDKIEQIAMALDFSGMRNIPLSEQLRHVESIGLSMAHPTSFAGVLNLRKMGEDPKGILGKTHKWVQTMTMIDQMDHHAAIKSVQDTKVLMDSILDNPESLENNPVLSKKAQEIGLTQKDMILLKKLLDNKPGGRWDEFKPEDFADRDLRDMTAIYLHVDNPNEFNEQRLLELRNSKIYDDYKDWRIENPDSKTADKTRKLEELRRHYNNTEISVDEYNAFNHEIHTNSPDKMEEDISQRLNEALSRIQNMETHFHNFLTSPKPDPMWGVALGNINKHSKNMIEANLIIKQSMMFQSTLVSILSQAKMTADHMGQHVGDQTTSVAKAKLVTAMGTNMALLATLVGTVNVMNDKAKGKKQHESIIGEGLRDDTVSGGLFYLKDITTGSTGMITKQLSNMANVSGMLDNPIINDMVTQIAVDKLNNQ